MAKTAEKTDPKLWAKVKEEVTASAKGGRAGQWSARRAQPAVQAYKKEPLTPPCSSSALKRRTHLADVALRHRRGRPDQAVVSAAVDLTALAGGGLEPAPA